jgi:hypothetical protein
MLDAQLLDEAGWEDSGRESASEPDLFLSPGLPPTRSWRRISSSKTWESVDSTPSSFRTRLDLDGAGRVLDKVDLGLTGQDARTSMARSAYDGLIVTVGQPLVFDFHGQNLRATVKGLHNLALESLTYFFALDLILMALAGSLIKLISV